MTDKWVNPVKQRLRQGKATFGCWCMCPSPLTAEVIASAGYDWAVIDMEHGPISVERCAEMAMAFRGTPTVPIARLPLNRQEYYKQALDAGVWGVLVPMISSVEEAREAVASAHYPPFGNRGRALGRTGFSTGLSVPDYYEQARDSVLVIVQVETPAGVGNAAEIAQVEGVDVVFIGPNDLGATLGAEQDSHELEIAIALAKDSVERNGKPVGIYCRSLDEAKYRLKQGFRFVGCSCDMSYLQSAAEIVVERLRPLVGE